MNSSSRLTSFRRRVSKGNTIVGTFQKTPNAAVTEVIALSGLDCVCIDAEHAPFDRSALDAAVLAARAHDLPSLIRVPDQSRTQILQALDSGASGILVPRVTSASEAQELLRSARYTSGGRGYSGATRAAGYGTRSMFNIVMEANEALCVIAQIEDESALGHVDEIAAVDGIDCLFVGRMDLTVSMQATSPDDPQVIDAVRVVCASGRRHNKPVGMFAASTADALAWRAEGASLFLLGSDQQWILQGGRELSNAFSRS